MSGHPGRSRICSRYRKPILKSTRRTRNSGIVSLDLMERIIRRRVSAVIGLPLECGVRALDMETFVSTVSRETIAI